MDTIPTDIIDSLPLPAEWTARGENNNSRPRFNHPQNPFATNHGSDEDESSVDAWEAPSESDMEGRRKFRKLIEQETLDHRRLQKHGGLHDTGRNIALCLADRERLGVMALTRRQSPRRVRASSVEGGRSPATVFESPISTTQSLSEHLAGNRNGGQDTPKSPDSSEGAASLPRPVSYPLKIAHEIRTFAEYCSATKFHSSFLHHLGGDDELDEAGNRPSSSRAVSTISVAFAPDAKTMASTHGDHTVKISCCTTGRLICSLEGHPRTPWTVKYHPKNSFMVASGCLGHQVRIWNWQTKACLQMVRLEFAIISLSFHPAGNLLAVANGTRLHFWGIDDPGTSSARAESNNGNNSNNNNNSRASQLTEMDQRHMLRCVHFPPDGKTLIIGGVNPEDPRRRTRGSGGMSFYLRLWDFDLEAALQPYSENVTVGTFMARRAISNPRTFVPRALLYNDGGFDVSPDGKTLCACAEYWLPDGVNSAMELLNKETTDFAADAATETERPSESVSEETPTSTASNPTSTTGNTQERESAHSPTRRPNNGPASTPQTPAVMRTPTTAEVPALEYVPRTPDHLPPVQSYRLSPPSPPGRRFAGGLQHGGREAVTSSRRVVPLPTSNVGGPARPNNERGFSTPPPPPPPPAPQAPTGHVSRPPHPLTLLGGATEAAGQRGRYVPHVVTVSLDTTRIPSEVDTSCYGRVLGAAAKGHQPRLGQLIEACPLDGAKASAVTCVKFSPSADYCLIGYGVREPIVEGGSRFHPVTAIYRIRGGMTHVSTMLSGDDDVNIARFHPEPGHGAVYGTKQGRVRVLAPRPWTYYNC